MEVRIYKTFILQGVSFTTVMFERHTALLLQKLFDFTASQQWIDFYVGIIYGHMNWFT